MSGSGVSNTLSCSMVWQISIRVKRSRSSAARLVDLVHLVCLVCLVWFLVSSCQGTSSENSKPKTKSASRALVPHTQHEIDQNDIAAEADRRHGQRHIERTQRRIERPAAPARPSTSFVPEEVLPQNIGMHQIPTIEQTTIIRLE